MRRTRNERKINFFQCILCLVCVYAAHIKSGMHRGSAHCRPGTPNTHLKHKKSSRSISCIHRWTQILRCICPGVAALYRRSLEFRIFVHLPSSTSSATEFNLFAHFHGTQLRRNASWNRKRLRKLSSNNSIRQIPAPASPFAIYFEIKFVVERKLKESSPKNGCSFRELTRTTIVEQMRSIIVQLIENVPLILENEKQTNTQRKYKRRTDGERMHRQTRIRMKANEQIKQSAKCKF